MAVKGLIAFFDTSVFINGILELGAPDDPSHRLMEALTEGRLPLPKTAWHCCLEFYSVTTRLPEGLRISADEAARLVEEELLLRCEVLDLPRGHRVSCMRAAASERITGGRVYDLFIAEIARAAGAKVVVTENKRHFSPLVRHGIRVITSEEYADEAHL